MSERMVTLEIKFDEFHARYDRDVEAAAQSRASTKDQLKAINDKLALLNDQEQQSIGMQRAAKIGWFVIGAIGSVVTWAGFPKIAALIAGR